MKLYVWRDVLVDYTGGIAVAMAETEDQARQLIIDAAEDYEKNMLMADLSKPADEVYDKPAGVHTWGGG